MARTPHVAGRSGAPRVPRPAALRPVLPGRLAAGPRCSVGLVHPLKACRVTGGTSIRDAALWAARRGWAVFPTRPGGKEPRPGLSWPNVATSDPARIAVAHWQAGEGYGIAAKASGLVVLDLDRPKPGYQLPEAWRDEPGIVDGRDILAVLAERAGVTSWPHTFTVTTPSGGWHLYYTAPPGRLIGNKPLGPLIDVRGGGDGNGGYVLGPGSVLNGRAYEIADDQVSAPLPAWIADLLDPPQPASCTLAQTAGGSVSDRFAARLASTVLPKFRPPYATAALVAEIDRVLAASPGTRNSQLNRSAFALGQLAGGGLLDEDEITRALLEAADRAGLIAEDGQRAVFATIHSGLTAGMTRPRLPEATR